jgi:predicted CoA-binding protein
MKKTVIIGASVNPERYAYKAAQMLLKFGHEICLYGLRAGQVNDIPIQTSLTHCEQVDTVTLYVSEKNQAEYIPFILALKPKRVIFNPGTENPAFEKHLTAAGIEPIEACTLVMLRTNQY